MKPASEQKTLRGGAQDLVDSLGRLHHRKSGKPPGSHHGTEVPTGQELQQMLGKAGFRSVSPRVSMGRAKAVVRKVAS
jgi:hypothetical protein